MESPTLTRLGRYELMELLGRGGMAEVYKARLPGALGISKLVAVKRILPEAVKNPEFVQMFVREARLSARMMHPNLIQVFEFDQSDNELFLAMELVEGPDLRKVLTANKSLGKTIPLEFAICVASGVLRGLDAAHRLTDEEGKGLQVVHRDLSPANVLLSYEGAIKVADFGVAHTEEGRTDPSDAGKVKGKLQYMAPEQLTSAGVDSRVDVFAAGAVLYEMLTGQPLYTWTTAAEVVQKVAGGRYVPAEKLAPDIEPGLLAVLSKALSANREERYPTCEQFALDLSKLVSQGRIPCAPVEELALYLQVLVPKQPFRVELHYTPEPADLVRPISAGSMPAAPRIDVTDPAIKHISASTPQRVVPPPQPPLDTNPGADRTRLVNPGTGPIRVAPPEVPTARQPTAASLPAARRPPPPPPPDLIIPAPSTPPPSAPSARPATVGVQTAARPSTMAQQAQEAVRPAAPRTAAGLPARVPETQPRVTFDPNAAPKAPITQPAAPLTRAGLAPAKPSTQASLPPVEARPLTQPKPPAPPIPALGGDLAAPAPAPAPATTLPSPDPSMSALDAMLRDYLAESESTPTEKEPPKVEVKEERKWFKWRR